jgi:exosortase
MGNDAVLNMRSDLFRRHLYFLLIALGSVVVFWTPLRDLIGFSMTHDYGSHIVLVAPASAYLIYLKRRLIFSQLQFSIFAGAGLFLAGAILGFTAHYDSLSRGVSLSVEILALIVLLISGFVLCYGMPAFRAARFPLLFLLLLVPIPDFLIEKVIFFLQTGSAEVAFWLLKVLNVPVLKEGFILRLPALDLEVAKQCSGIRSSLALLITTLLLGDFVLRSAWRKSLLVLSIVPILILKNGLRIATLAVLTIYVDRRFLYGWLHHSGGIVFYLLGLLALVPIIIPLRKSEIRSGITAKRTPALSGTTGANSEA